MPDWRDEIRRRLNAANLDPAREAEVADELAQHLDDRYAELRSAGMPDDAARRAALDELREDARMRRDLASVEGAASTLPPPGAPVRGSVAADGWRDVRYAVRMLRRAPAFTVVAILTLALGIGASVAIASAVYAVLYRPLPIAEADRLVVPVSTNARRNIERGSVPYADYVDWRAEADLFEQVAVFNATQADLSGDGSPERVSVLQASREYFPAMQAAPLHGRLLTDGDFAADAPRAVVLADTLWKRRFGGEPGVIGRDVRIGGNLATVVGVVEATRLWPMEQEVVVPLPVWQYTEDQRARRDNMIFQAIARLRPGATLDEGRARVAAIAQRVAREHPESRADWSTNLVPLRDYIVDPEIRLGMFVLLGGVGLVLLIACVNLANLLLARGADRGREMAVRAALGASRGRLAWQMIVESLVLAAAGGAAGLVASRWLLAGLRAAAPRQLPMLDSMAIDGVAVAAALVLTLAAALLFGIVPALTVSSAGPVEGLREGGRSAGTGRRAGRLRDTMVVAQVALAIVLLLGSGLMLRSFEHLVTLDPGVDLDRVLVGRISVPSARYPQPKRAQFYERLTTALAAEPGVEAAAATSFVPPGGRGFGLGRVFLVEGQPEPPASTDHPAFWNVVTPGYFRTMGIPLLRGRAFTPQDTADGVQVMIINQTLARRVFGTEDPVGRRMRSWRDENRLREIVGVVADVRYMGRADEERGLVYVPHAQDPWGSLAVALRTTGDPSAFAETLRREVARLDPDIAVARIAPLSALAADSIAPQRFGALLLSLFAAAAALLASIGVYGVMTYAVTQRRHEFGVRLALGARPSRLFALIVRRGLSLAGIGGVVGLAGGLAVAPLLATLLTGVEPSDPVTIAAVTGLLAFVALAACAIPARRAARTHPLEALRD